MKKSSESLSGIVITTTPDKKTLLRILARISEQGYISEIELFSYFPNRKIAIEACRYLTNGRYAALHYEIDGGERRYFVSEHFRQKYVIPEVSA